MRVVDWRRHHDFGFVSRVTEHQTLVTSTLFVIVCFIDALGNVTRLAADGVHDRAGITIKSAFRVIVANVVNDLTNQALNIDIGLGGNLASHDNHACLDHGFAGNAGLFILL